MATFPSRRIGSGVEDTKKRGIEKPGKILKRGLGEGGNGKENSTKVGRELNMKSPENVRSNPHADNTHWKSKMIRENRGRVELNKAQKMLKLQEKNVDKKKAIAGK